MEIFFDGSNFQKYCIEVHPQITVGEVKEQLAIDESMDAESICLLFQGVALEDDDAFFADLGIGAEAHLHCEIIQRSVIHSCLVTNANF